MAQSATYSKIADTRKLPLKAMDDIGVVMTPFGDVVTVSLVANSYVVGFFPLKSGVIEVY